MIPLESNLHDFAVGDFSKSTFVQRARDLVPVLRERAQKQWATNRLLDETAELIHEAGLWRMLQPRRFGGGETSPMEWLEAMSTLAEGDPSVAWVTGVLGIHSFHLAHFDDRAQQEAWGPNGNPRALLSSPYAPHKVKPVDGGFLLNGIWPFASGVHHCHYALVGGAVYESEDEEQGDRLRVGDYRAFMVPRSDFTIRENWKVYGMRGTGSHDIVIKDVFVPEYRTLSFAKVRAADTPGSKVNTGILYKLPFFQVLGRITTSPVPLGALKGMADTFCEQARGRTSNRGVKTAEDGDATKAIANALSEVDEIKGNCYRNLYRLMKGVAEGNPIPLDMRLMMRFQTTSTSARVADLAVKVYKSCGGSGIYEANPYGRYLNDILAVIGHTSNNSQMDAALWAGHLMGVDVSNKELRC